MCIGIPMEILEQREFSALCRGRSGEKVVETLFIGRQPVGTWVLSHLGAAREVITAEEAAKLNDALDAVDALARGEQNIDLDAHFSDLVDPQRQPGGLPGNKTGGSGG